MAALHYDCGGLVESKLWWFCHHWRRYKIISGIISALWALHMFYWGATQHIAGQSGWDTADAACDHAIKSGIIIWFLLLGCWFGAAITAIAYDRQAGETVGQAFRGLTLALCSGGIVLLFFGGFIVIFAWTVGYAPPIKSW